jgi:hypothetical protein
MRSERVPDPWRSFLADIDAASPSAIELHCIGGFAVTLHYQFMRPTRDVDVSQVIPGNATAWLTSIAGEGSELHKKHRIFVQIASVAILPENYAERLIELFRGEFERLRILVPDPYDLALSKLERNSDVDIEDVKHLARTPGFQSDVLAARYETELRPYLAGPESRHDLTLRLWVEMIAEERASQPPHV